MYLWSLAPGSLSLSASKLSFSPIGPRLSSPVSITAECSHNSPRKSSHRYYSCCPIISFGSPRSFSLTHLSYRCNRKQTLLKKTLAFYTLQCETLFILLVSHLQMCLHARERKMAWARKRERSLWTRTPVTIFPGSHTRTDETQRPAGGFILRVMEFSISTLHEGEIEKTWSFCVQ